ncbi:hypothetical protein CLU79DRAFT_760308 [Phycomyces nitens]|nr:hypothetical protein CLU79DRAFT_760308 [Phycomyces nitens]
MCDLNWCPSCDKAISPDSKSLYCSMTCLQQDALNKNPLLGYDFSDFHNFLPPIKHCHYDNISLPESEPESDPEEERDTLATPASSPSRIVFSTVPEHTNSFKSYKSLLEAENKTNLRLIWGSH